MKNKKNITIIVMALIAFAGLMFLWSKHFGSGGDLGAHAFAALEMNGEQGLQSYNSKITYPLWHYMFCAIYEFMGLTSVLRGKITIAIALTETIFLTVTCGLILWYLYQSDGAKKKFLMPVYIVLAFGLIMAGPFYVKAINEAYYIGQLTPNPWHNPTTIAAKPFALGAFFCYARSLKANDKNEICMMKSRKIRKDTVYLAAFAFLLAISAFAKPSFYQMFIPGLFLFCALDVIRTRFRSIWFCVKTGISVLPTCAIALVQYHITISTSNRMFIKWGDVWGELTRSIPLSVLISIIFPVFMLIVLYKQVLSDRKIQLAIFAFLSGVVQFAAFSFEIKWGNDFAWGAYLGTLLLFLISVELLLRCWHEKGVHWITISGSVLFGIHVLFGTWYWIQMYQQGTYYI